MLKFSTFFLVLRIFKLECLKQMKLLLFLESKRVGLSEHAYHMVAR